MPNQPPGPTGPDAADDRWTQRGAFSIFFDVAAGADTGEMWRTRIYHEETGEEQVITGRATEAWSGWILARLGAAEPGGRDPIPVRIEVVAVDLLDRDVAAGADIVRIMSTLRVHGLSELERVLGTALVERGLGRRPGP
jgi:hypothetical protein